MRLYATLSTARCIGSCIPRKKGQAPENTNRQTCKAGLPETCVREDAINASSTGTVHAQRADRTFYVPSYVRHG